ncbi:hypothetical protein ENUP19_0179G0013 [Entamoeba nuttalli]|uniref:60S acidic riboomal protein P1, putative n=2 Tax=Entamoeba nuttalli TaxID=412467 RepID=K2HMZ9_ENTNP|nr:60S acidic riboomal protein P1, putative [Entamoeba nuttalli P19]EKE37175.1 60S acidic riboomal protein P1, putative [Entamoeba nuttalli P19]|eukprot:XP_008860490.1 60S acidic riboomal protein P1, putative [Entamoeba nuttalli P19]
MEADHQQLAIAFAALLIHGCGKEVNAESILAVTKAAGIQLEGWANAMGKAFNGEKIEKLLEGFSSAAPVAAPAAAVAAPTETKEEKKEDKKEEEEEEDFGGFGDLF